MATISQKFSIENLVSHSLSSSVSPDTGNYAFNVSFSRKDEVPDSIASSAYISNFLSDASLNSLYMVAAKNTVENSTGYHFDNVCASNMAENSELNISDDTSGWNATNSPELSDKNSAVESGGIEYTANSKYINSTSFTAIVDKVLKSPGTESVDSTKFKDLPVRQILSYLDVIFPHIQMIYGNIESSAPQRVRPSGASEMECDESDSGYSASGISNNGEQKLSKEWIELVKKLFFNFPGPTGEIRKNSVCNAMSAGNGCAAPTAVGTLGGAFFFQQMQKSKRNRTAFSTQQLNQLERAFCTNHYVIGNERKNLADCLNLSETQVKVWFQNRRTKQKRVESVPRS